MPKILLCGNDKELIDNLFKEEKSSLMFMSTTDNPDDIRRHLKMFLPKAFAFCLNNQSEESLQKVGDVLEFIEASNASFILIGNDSEMDAAFSRFGPSKVKFTLSKEIGMNVLLEKLESLDESSPIDVASNSVPMDSSPIESLEDLDNLDSIQDAMNAQVSTSIPGEKKKILIIDDDTNMLRTLKLYLQDDFSVAVANSGQVALKFLEERVVDLILLDYMMPVMDGPMTLKYIRGSVLTHKIPVIFLTGVSDRDKIRQILGLQVQGYLLKPVEKNKLHEIINKTLNGA